MNNIHTLDSLNNNSNSNTVTLTQDSINEASQLLPVLKLRASNIEINEIQNSLDRLVGEHLKYYEENGSSSLSESFPSIYPAAIEDGIPVTNLFDIIQNIYNRFINSDIDIDENNINTLSNLILNDPSSGGLNENIKDILNTVVNDLNNSINTNNLKPLGQFGDITLNELILKGQNLDFSFLMKNQELVIYPLKLISVGLVYGTVVRLFMKHCDDYNSINRIKNIGEKTHFLRVRRVNIAVTLALTAPLATVLLVKFGKVSIFDSLGLKLGVNKNNIVNSNELLNNILQEATPLRGAPAALFSTLHTRGRIAPRPDSNEQKKKNHLNPKFIKFILFLLLLIICVGLYKYNIFMYIINYINLFFLIYLWFLILIFSIVYNSVGFFILINKNEIDIDISKLRNKFIRNTIESFIAIRNSNIDKEKMEKYFISHLYLSLFLLIISGILIFF
jgi:hypothetical protein